MNKKEKELRNFLEKRIDKKRLEHSINTANEAVSLAEKYGEDKEKAYIAGLLHDTAKGKCKYGLKKLSQEYDITMDEYEKRNPELTHGKLGAIMVSKHLGIQDKDILSAIRWHTTGRANMSLLEKVIYLADIIEPSRTFDGVKKIKLLAYKDIDAAMVLALEYVMKFVHKKGFALHPKSIEAYKYFKELEGNK